MAQRKRASGIQHSERNFVSAFNQSSKIISSYNKKPNTPRSPKGKGKLLVFYTIHFLFDINEIKESPTQQI